MSTDYLFNNDRVIDCAKLEDGTPFDWIVFQGHKGIKKIVLGQLGEDGAKAPLQLPPLPDGENFARLFPDLKHLYIWNCTGLGPILSKLPDELECLDVRGCKELVELPELPRTLETLDVADCSALAAWPTSGLSKLRWLHIDRVVQIPAHRFQVFLEECRGLEELTAIGCTQLDCLALPCQEKTLGDSDRGAHPRFPQRRLKKLVLQGCTGLRRLPDLSCFPWLHHLNINGCANLATLPRIPVGESAGEATGLRTLYAHDCSSLRTYRGFDLRPVHLSTSDGDNVADVLRTLDALGAESADLVMAKVLFLGSGRCGKTTISKALQWMALSAGERAKHSELDPTLPQKSTHGVRFAALGSAFEFAPVTLSKPGTLHLWDFGGQEVYHATHRLFASQGSVFIIATTTPEIHRVRLDEEKRDTKKGHQDAFEAENEYRELKYWLDYIRNALGLTAEEEICRRASVIVVHTGTANGEEARRYLEQQAGPYADLLRSGDIKVLSIDFQTFKAENPPSGFVELRSWVQRRAAQAADEFGTRVPALVKAVAERCEALVLGRREGDRIMSWEAWSRQIASSAGTAVMTPRGLAECSRATSRYLHHCGRVFCIHRGHETCKVVINQQWGVDLIYALTRDAARDPDLVDDLRELTADLFSPEKLRAVLERRDQHFQSILAAENWPVFLEMLDQCDVCVRVGDKMLAVQSELLPDLTPALQKKLEIAWREARLESAEALSNYSFALHGDQGGMLGNSDYRAVVAFVARGLSGELMAALFGPDQIEGELAETGKSGSWRRHATTESQCWFWNGGFMVKLMRKTDREGNTAKVLMLRVEWSHCRVQLNAKRSFEGGLFIQLLNTDDEIFPKRLRELLFGKNGPLAFFGEGNRLKEHDHRPDDLPKEVLPHLRGFGQPDWTRLHEGPPRPGLRHEVAISYRSTEKALVLRLCAALEAHGLSVYHYGEDTRLLDEAKRADRPGGSLITDIYDYLRRARVLLVVPSPSYFDDPSAKGNRYCPIELAEAILAITTDSPARPAGAFFWAAGEGALTPSKLESEVKEVINKHYIEIVDTRRNNTSPTKIDRREDESIRQARETEKMTVFLNSVGRTSKQYLNVLGPAGDFRFEDLVVRIKSALATPAKNE